jgi:hypothetical protein
MCGLESYVLPEKKFMFLTWIVGIAGVIGSQWTSTANIALVVCPLVAAIQLLLCLCRTRLNEDRTYVSLDPDDQSTSCCSECGCNGFYCTDSWLFFGSFLGVSICVIAARIAFAKLFPTITA